MMRVEKDKERRRAVIPQDTTTITVANLVFFHRLSWVGVGGSYVILLKCHRTGIHFFKECWFCLDPENAGPSLSSGGVSDTRPMLFFNTPRIRSVCIFLFPKKLRIRSVRRFLKLKKGRKNLVSPFFLNENTQGSNPVRFSRCSFSNTRYPCSV